MIELHSGASVGVERGPSDPRRRGLPAPGRPPLGARSFTNRKEIDDETCDGDNPKARILRTCDSMAFAPVIALARQPPAGAQGITGTWNHVLTVRNCAMGAVIAQSNPMGSYLESRVAVEMNPLPGGR